MGQKTSFIFVIILLFIFRYSIKYCNVFFYQHLMSKNKYGSLILFSSTRTCKLFKTNQNRPSLVTFCKDKQSPLV